MKLFKQLAINITLLSIILSFSACSSDDDSESLQEYVLGTWRVYKCVIYEQGEKSEMEVSKSGQYSHEYFEIKFEKKGNATIGYWDVDKNWKSSWLVKNVTYVIKDDIVELDNDGFILTLMYEKSEKVLYYRYYESSKSYSFLYLKK